MGVGSASVVDYANTYPGTASHVNATGSVGDFEVVVDGSGATTLSLNFQTTATLDPRITFSRTSNATLVGPDGLIQYAPHNLLTYSEQFDNAVWNKNASIVITANANTAPDGTMTADEFSGSLVNCGVWRVPTTTASIPHIYSIYLKNVNNATNLLVGCDANPTNAFIRFNSVTGEITSVTGNVTSSSVIAIGNGWYRVTVGFVPTTTLPTFVLYSTSGASATWLVWGAQLNEGALQPYYSTTVKNLLGYSQNFENAAWTKSNSSVLYNLESYSQQFSNAFWDKAGGLTTVTDNFTTAPDGTTTATKWTEAAGTGSHHIHDLVGSYTPVIDLPYTMSMYLKQTETNPDRYVQMTFWLAGFSATAYANFDMQTGIVAFQGASITNAVITPVGSGWYRLSITSLATATGASGWQAAFVSSGTAPRAESYTVTAGNEESYYLWGAQVVASPSAENYTVTTSASAPIQAIGPFGFAGGEKLVENTATSQHSIANPGTITANSTITGSCYIKAGERTTGWVQINNSGYTSGFRAQFNTSSGLATSATFGTGSVSNITMTPIGNGWYRVAATGIIDSSSTSAILSIFLNNGTSYTGNGTSGIYIFGAQLSDSASLDPYSYNPVAAPTSTAYYGPRFDYDPATLAPKGLLIEEQRTNLLTYSSEFDNAAWAKPGTPANILVNTNAAIAPDGTTTADKIIDNTTTAQHLISQVYATTLGQTYTYSIYAKMTSPAEWTVFRLQLGSGGGIGAFDLSAVTASIANANAISASIIPVGNGWFRCSLVSTSNGSSNNYIYKNAGTYTGDGTSGIYLWGAQLEAGAFPTSYIPTTSATVTRAADIASMVGSNFSSWYNQSEGTIVTSFDMYYATGTIGAFPRVISVSNGSSANLIDIQSTQYTNENMTIVDTSVQQCSINATQFAANTQGKFAGSFATNNFQISANGVLGIADTVGTVPTVNQMQIGNRWDLIRPMSGHIQSIKYYPTRLPNGTLQGLTA